MSYADTGDIAFGTFITIAMTATFFIATCGITNENIDKLEKKVDKIHQVIVPEKSPEQIKLEAVEKQLDELVRANDKASCTQ